MTFADDYNRFRKKVLHNRRSFEKVVSTNAAGISLRVVIPVARILTTGVCGSNLSAVIRHAGW